MNTVIGINNKTIRHVNLIHAKIHNFSLINKQLKFMFIHESVCIGFSHL
jgi:hypothetical protein